MSRVRTAHLIFPPQFEPFQSYLAGPYLKALLAEFGITASVYDANIDFYEWLIARHAEEAGERDGSRAWPYLRASVFRALRVIHGGADSLGEYRWAVNVLDEFLRVSSRPEMKVSLTSLKVGNRYSSTDLREYGVCTQNGLLAYFQEREDALLGSEETNTYLLSLVVIDQLAAAMTFAREIKRRRPRARVIVGGPLISRLHRQLQAVPWICETVDAIVPGEADHVLPAVLGLPGQYNGHVTPDFSDLDLDRYWSCRRVLPYLVARGCKWGKCTFCSHHLTYRRYRPSPMVDVLNDIEALSARYSTEYVSFCDEYLTPQQLRELAKRPIR